jgi:lipid-A-disaccharide synthase-like uncharacterized protein
MKYQNQANQEWTNPTTFTENRVRFLLRPWNAVSKVSISILPEIFWILSMLRRCASLFLSWIVLSLDEFEVLS